MVRLADLPDFEREHMPGASGLNPPKAAARRFTSHCRGNSRPPGPAPTADKSVSSPQFDGYFAAGVNFFLYVRSLLVSNPYARIRVRGQCLMEEGSPMNTA